MVWRVTVVATQMLDVPTLSPCTQIFSQQWEQQFWPCATCAPEWRKGVTNAHFSKKGRKPDHELHRGFMWTAGARYWKANARVCDQFRVRIHYFCFMHRRFTSTSPKLDNVAVRSYEWHVRQPWPCRTHQYNKEHLMPAIMRPLMSLLMPARQLSCLGIHPFMLPWFESKETRNIRCSKCKSGVPFCIGL